MSDLKPYFSPVVSVSSFSPKRSMIGRAGRTNKYLFERSRTLPGGVSQRSGANIGDLTRIYAINYETVSSTHGEPYQNLVTPQPFSYALRTFVPDLIYRRVQLYRNRCTYYRVSVRKSVRTSAYRFALSRPLLTYICMMMIMISEAYLFAVRTPICLLPISERELLLSPDAVWGCSARFTYSAHWRSVSIKKLLSTYNARSASAGHRQTYLLYERVRGKDYLSRTVII